VACSSRDGSWGCSYNNRFYEFINNKLSEENTNEKKPKKV